VQYGHEKTPKSAPDTVKVSGNLLPTGYASNHQAHTRTLTKETHPEPTFNAGYLSERFLRLRKRNDYLHWGGTGPPFVSTLKFEMAHPEKQEPRGGKRDPWAKVTYDARRSGYEMNVTDESPMIRDKRLVDHVRPVTVAS